MWKNKPLVFKEDGGSTGGTCNDGSVSELYTIFDAVGEVGYEGGHVVLREG